jgi:hypothetical protein
VFRNRTYVVDREIAFSFAAKYKTAKMIQRKFLRDEYFRVAFADNVCDARIESKRRFCVRIFGDSSSVVNGSER